MKIHCIGNSHVNAFKGIDTIHGSDTIPIFKTHCIGPTIAYNFYEHHYPKVLEYIINTRVDKGNDYIILVVGEVDCRWHLPKQAEIQNRCVYELTKECINRYFKVLYDLKIRGYKVVGWGGHPSTTSGHNSNEFCPVYGDCLQRNKVSKYWNECIKELCEKESIPFISIMDELIDEENGLTKM